MLVVPLVMRKHKEINFVFRRKHEKGEKPSKYLGHFNSFVSQAILGFYCAISLWPVGKTFKRNKPWMTLFPCSRFPHKTHPSRAFACLKLKTIRWAEPLAHLSNSSNHHVFTVCSGLKPNKRYFRWFYCHALDFWCQQGDGVKLWENENQKVVHETCNENCSDLYRHIINLIYNNEASAFSPDHLVNSHRPVTTLLFLSRCH